VNNQLRK